VYLGFTGDAEVSVSGNTVTWTIPSLAAGGSQVYTIQVQARQVGSITNTVRVQVPEDQENTSTQPEDSDTNQVNPFFIPNVITPGNADGKNDTFEIRGIDRFAQSSLTILNRNGDHVFVSEDYQNDWEAQGLNAGSYFYVLVITDRAGESQTYKGWLQVVK
jgi:gliding motility-associated-like protein